MKRFREFSEAKDYKIVPDGSVIGVHYDGKHIGNFMEKKNKTPLTKKSYVAYSKHWSMKREHPSKKAAAEWLVQTHKTAEKIP